MASNNMSSELSVIENSSTFHKPASTFQIDSKVPTSGENNVYKMYKRRWLGMIVIVALNLATGFLWLTFNSVTKISESWLNSSKTEVNLSVMLYFLGSIVMSSFSGFVFEKWGVKQALIIGGALNLVGTWIRYFGSFINSSEDSHEARLIVVLFGQFIAACAQPFFLNAGPKYSAVWFSDSSRTVAITIATVSNPVSAAVAMLVIPAICEEPNGDDMPFTLLMIAIFSIIVIIPAFLIPSAPPTPPSASAEISLAETADESFFKALKQVSKNTQFWILFTAFAVYVAIFNSISSLINQIVIPYGYSDDDAGLFGACMILAGIVGAAIAGVYLDRTKQYKFVLRIATPFLALGYTALIFAVRENSFVWIALVCAELGFVSFALLPVALELGVECTYPCPPSTATSVMWMGGQSIGVAFIFLGDLLRNSNPFQDNPYDNLKTGLIAVAVVSCLTTLFSFTFNSPYYRMEAEKNNNTVK